MTKKIRAFLATLPWREIVLDVSALSGAALIAYGAHQVYVPAGYIVGGLLVLVGSILVGRPSQ